mgnify:CR=1 FL=1
MKEKPQVFTQKPQTCYGGGTYPPIHQIQVWDKNRWNSLCQDKFMVQEIMIWVTILVFLAAISHELSLWWMISWSLLVSWFHLKINYFNVLLFIDVLFIYIRRDLEHLELDLENNRWPKGLSSLWSCWQQVIDNLYQQEMNHSQEQNNYTRTHIT